MGRTAVNVAGQALIPTIVAKRQGILDEALYNAPRNGDPFTDDAPAPASAASAAEASEAARSEAAAEGRELAGSKPSLGPPPAGLFPGYSPGNSPLSPNRRQGG